MPRTTMLTERALGLLMAWTSPAYPVGAFSYSHGLEAAVEAGDVRDVGGLVAYVAAVIERGGAWIDAVLFAAAWRAADDPDALDELADLAAAFRGSAETALESRQTGDAFLAVTRAAFPAPALDAFHARRGGRPTAYCIAAALAATAHGVPLRPALMGMLHGMTANLVSAGVRLVPLGQTDGQRATAALLAIVEAVTDKALAAEPDDLATSAPLLELASLAHETQYSRLFRS